MPRDPKHLFPGTLLWLSVVTLAGATLLSLLGRLHWFFELFTHFPLQIASGLIIVILATLLFRRWIPAAIGLLCLLPHLTALSHYYPSREFSTEPSDFRVLSFNVLTSNQSHDAVLSYLSECDADFIFLMEINPDWVEALSPLDSDYPYFVKFPRPDNFGMTLYSRHPFVSHEIRFIEGVQVPLVHAVIDLGGHELEVIGCHPVPPMGARQASARNDYLAGLTEITTTSTLPAVILGDFNATVWSPHLREFIKTTSLMDSGRKRGFQPTWRWFNPFFSIPIDHVFHNAALSCTNRQIGPALGSDHRPVITEFALTP
ncbi:MAG TPA: endonuclease/exonuclease/phosphatase family protein [Roseibacillus sp.]|jgi:endonuclease/exonuclease/phosphatase (EEP) superfamily protein YafD|nr:endonuclease/exonuclease/phosphatase family protein [Roseibacillus sp.]HJM62099.1 endonuclease/exonuclease/phosphatase family protein [Roseibacillus sp.]|tara:strand:- start:825 stop:1772 length:948 start_codon:yes stop_codon:yes gene_type:complete